MTNWDHEPETPLLGYAVIAAVVLGIVWAIEKMAVIALGG